MTAPISARVAPLLALSLLVAAPSVAQQSAAPDPSAPIRNFLRVDSNFCTGGQPRLEHLDQLKADGVKAIINLRQPTEHRADEEAAKAKELGLRYFNIPGRLQGSEGRTGRRVPEAHRRSGESARVHPLHGGGAGRRLLDDPARGARRLADREGRGRGAEDRTRTTRRISTSSCAATSPGIRNDRRREHIARSTGASPSSPAAGRELGAPSPGGSLTPARAWRWSTSPAIRRTPWCPRSSTPAAWRAPSSPIWRSPSRPRASSATRWRRGAASTSSSTAPPSRRARASSISIPRCGIATSPSTCARHSC